VILPEFREDSRLPERARRQGAALLLTPELSLCGYPPEDLLLRDGFYRLVNLH